MDQSPLIGGHKRDGKADRMHRMDFAFRGGRRFVNCEIGHVEFIGLFVAEVIGQVHIAIVQQTLRYAQVLSLVTVDHGDLAEVERIEGIYWRADGEDPAGNIEVGAFAGIGVGDGQMYVTEEDQADSPESVRGPEYGQERKDLGQRRPQRDTAQGQQQC